METMKVAGPDHPIHLEAAARRVRARYKGRVIADSDGVLMLREAGYHPVAYFPRQDVSMEYLSRSERRSFCPYKGHASYFTILMDGKLAQDAGWSYENPFPAMEVIGERIAFFPHPVEVYAAEETRLGPSPDEVVLHTDAGDGVSQDPHWPPTTQEPA